MTQVDTYPGLASFQDHNLDRLLFCGRNEERRTLLNLVVGESISVLYSRSGLGKTSLINATLLQELRERNYFPVVARLTDVKAGPRESIISAIETQACARNVGIRGAGPAASLWEYLVDLELHTAGGAWKLVLVIDQFEELFTRIRERDREAGTQVEQTFIDELSDIVRHRLPATLRERLTRELEELDHRSYELAIADGTAPADFDPAIDCCDRER
ncbi:MAG TPA: hypothetical protein VHK90_17755, partial [Thermoanaerobaculia bacterium]|nr:hypothetical protein [Thermoanaerobaculia bacterium]